MNLTDNRQERIGASNLTSDGDLSLRCQEAAELIFNGQYEEARERLGAFWPGVGRRPLLEGLADAVKAELLLQCGTLSGRFGSIQSDASAQDAAKDLISESVWIFESLGVSAKVAEAEYELSACYWRQGSLDEARVVLTEALGRLGKDENELRAKILIRRSLIDVSARRYNDALSVLKEAETVYEFAGDALKGRWHGQRALVLLQLYDSEGKNDYADRAIIEFTAAACHLEQAGHNRFCGNTLNNLALLLNKLGRHAAAHENLDRARRIFKLLKDAGSVAQVDETRTRVLVAEGRYAEARKVIAGAVLALGEGGEQALLADALALQGIVQARLGEYEDSIETLREAVVTAEVAGAPAKAGNAALTLVEEHGRGRLSEVEAYEAYRRADEFLSRTQDAEDLARLRACARVVMGRFGGAELPEGFSLPNAVLTYEARFIEQALLEEGGSVSRAAKRLGVKHQSLAHMLRARHSQLLAARTPAVPRRRSIIRIRETRRGGRYESPAHLQPVSVLHVDENPAVTEGVRDVLEEQGWRVESCRDGLRGLSRLEGEDHYDLLIIDCDLPDVDGLAIVRRTRQIPHRRGLPIIMLSASSRRAEAHRIGVDVFLQKPEGVVLLAETASRLLEG